MDLKGHLLYIDITQICGVGCDFCMYADKHSSGINMELSVLARKNLSALINSPDVKRISVSGEGEPLNNAKVFHEILRLSEGGKCFEFITSGFLPHDKMFEFYETTNQIVLNHGDTCNIRLSTDSHHIERVKWRAHGFSLNYLRSQCPSGLSFSFRSIDTDRNFAREYLVSELARWDIHATIEPLNVLEDALVTDSDSFSIDYKNLVHPAGNTPDNYLNMFDYIKAVESKVHKKFTFGSMNKLPLSNGIDLTVKPNGDVFLYGIENKRLANINLDQLRWEYLATYIRDTPLVRELYTQPLVHLLEKLDDKELVATVLAKANNPYWIVKEFVKHDGLVEKLVSS